MQNRADLLIAEKLKEEISEDNMTGVYMYWDSTSVNKDKTSKHENSGKAIIETAEKNKPKQVRFEHPEDYVFCTTKNEKFSSDWQSLIYKVDVDLIKKGEKIIAYSITKVYHDDTLEDE